MSEGIEKKGWRPPKPSRAKRKIKKKSSAHFVGQATFGEERGQGQCVAFESKLELDSFLLMIYAPGIIDVEEQIEPVRYLGADGKEHLHYLDFRATRVGGQKIAAAVKNPVHADSARFRDEMERVSVVAMEGTADKVVVVSKRNIDPRLLERASLFHACRFPQAEIDATLQRYIDNFNGTAVLRDLLADADLGDAGFHAAVRLIRVGVLVVSEDVRITLSCSVSKGVTFE